MVERDFRTIFGITHSLLLGAPHFPEKLWAEAVKAAVHIRNRTPTDFLGGKAPLEAWESKPPSNMKHMHEWGSLAFKGIDVRHRNGKLTPRAKKMHLVSYNTKSMTYMPVGSSQERCRVARRAPVTLVAQRQGMIRFPIRARYLWQGSRLILKQKKQRQESAEKSMAPPEQQTILRKSNRQQGISPDSVSAQQWSLLTNVDDIHSACVVRAS